MSLIFATQLTAAATTALAALAIVTAVFAFVAFRKQSKEVSDQAEMLKIQSKQLDEQRKVNTEQIRVLELEATELRESLDEREREAEERRQAQASRVFIWQDRSTNQEIGKPRAEMVTAHVENTSEQPIYDLRFSWHDGDLPVAQNRGEQPLMPGAKDGDAAELPAGSDPDKFGAVALFRDRAGIWWRARPGGKLEELPPGSEPPHSW